VRDRTSASLCRDWVGQCAACLFTWHPSLCICMLLPGRAMCRDELLLKIAAAGLITHETSPADAAALLAIYQGVAAPQRAHSIIHSLCFPAH
jgi:hypothetical protein